MTRTANARIAGFTFLAYIAATVASMVIFGRMMSGEGLAAKLAALSHHSTDVGVVVLLTLVQSFSALVLAVTLHAITRVEDRDLAMLGMICRVCECLLGALSIPGILALFWLSTATGADAPELAIAHVLGTYLQRGAVAFSASFFAVGSTLFCYLLLRGRMIPIVLAWLGVAASVLLVVCLPLQLADFLGEPITTFMWLPMLAFEIPLGFWFLFRGVAGPASAPSGSS